MRFTMADQRSIQAQTNHIESSLTVAAVDYEATTESAMLESCEWIQLDG